MLTLKNPEICIDLTNPSSSFRFAQEMMKRIFDMQSKDNYSYWNHNSADAKAMTFFGMAEFVRRCHVKGLSKVSIVQDADYSIGHDGHTGNAYYWAVKFIESDGTIIVSKGLMDKLIKD